MHTKLTYILRHFCLVLLLCFGVVGPALADTADTSTRDRPEWVQRSLDLAYFIEDNEMVVSEHAKRAFQDKIDTAEGEEKLTLMYFHVLEASIYGYEDIMDIAMPAYIVEIERQDSKDHRALLGMMNAFSDYYRGRETGEDPLERINQIHQNIEFSVETRARAMIMEGYLYGFAKKPEMTLALYQEVKALVSDIPPNDFLQTEILEFEFFVNLIVGDYEQMIRPAREKLELAQRLGLLISGDSFSYHLARVIMESGQTSAIYEIDAVNQRIASLTKNDVSKYHASFLCGRNFLMLQANERALQCLQAAEPFSSAMPEREIQLNFYLSMAYARAGDLENARDYFQRVESDDTFLSNPFIQSNLSWGRSELLHAEGNYVQASKLQRDFHNKVSFKKANELSLVVKQMREYSETQFAAQQERELLLEVNSKLKDHAILNQKIIITATGVVAFAAILFLILQIRLARKLRSSRREAEIANRAKSEFLANMSHEIRTPMNGVLGMTEVLMRSGLDKKQNAYAETVYKSGNALMVILNDILDFSKIEAGKLDLCLTPLDLNAAVEDVATLLSATAHEKSLEVVVRYAPDLPKNVVGDEGRIRQVLMNLMSNAVKFTETGYVMIDVAGEVIDGAVNLKFKVIDTGIGVSESHSKKIFEGFIQAEGSTTRRYGGTGLGLTISRQLVEVMGGEIGVESTLGKGSEFWVKLKLPLAEVSEPPTLVLKGHKVMILDDLQVNLDVYGEYVSALGGVPVMMSNTKEAILALRQATSAGVAFDVIIIDYKMPDANGAAVAKFIHQDESIGQVKTILTSMEDLSSYRDRLSRIGVADICMKPVSARALGAALEKTLPSEGEKRSARQVARPILASENPSQTSQIRRRDHSVISVLIADDDATNRFVLSNFLGSEYFEIDEAVDGIDAVNQAFDKSYDLIFMDISMPGLDGVKATNAIRSCERGMNRETPIVACTAHAITGDKEKFLAAGMSGYLSKPVSKSEVNEMVEAMVRPRALNSDVALAS